jgi:hypothetical protein
MRQRLLLCIICHGIALPRMRAHPLRQACLFTQFRVWALLKVWLERLGFSIRFFAKALRGQGLTIRSSGPLQIAAV